MNFSKIFIAIISIVFSSTSKANLVGFNDIPVGLCDIQMTTAEGQSGRGQGTLIGNKIISAAHVLEGVKIDKIFCTGDIEFTQADVIRTELPLQTQLNDIGYLVLKQTYETDIDLVDSDLMNVSAVVTDELDAQYKWVRYTHDQDSIDFSTFSLDTLVTGAVHPELDPRFHIVTSGVNSITLGDSGGALLKQVGVLKDGEISYRFSLAGIVIKKPVHASGPIYYSSYSVFEKVFPHLSFLNGEFKHSVASASDTVNNNSKKQIRNNFKIIKNPYLVNKKSPKLADDYEAIIRAYRSKPKVAKRRILIQPAQPLQYGNRNKRKRTSGWSKILEDKKIRKSQKPASKKRKVK